MRNKAKMMCTALAAALVISGMPVGSIPVSAKPVATVAKKSTKTKTIVVTTQTGLNKALAKAKTGAYSKITVSGKASKISIPNGVYQCSITVDTPKASVANNGVFRSIAVKAARQYTESAIGNRITISSQCNLTTFGVAKSGNVTELVVNQKAGAISVRNNGTIGDVSITGASSVLVSGPSKSTVSLAVKNKAAKVTVKCRAKISADKAAKLVIGKGGTVSTLEVGSVPDVVCSTGAKVTNATVKTPSTTTIHGNGCVSNITGSLKGSLVVNLPKCKPKITVSVKGSKVIAATPVTMKYLASGTVILKDDAKGSSITGTKDGISVKVTNNTAGNVVIKDVSGNSKKLGVGRVSNVNKAGVLEEGSKDLKLNSVSMGNDEKTVRVFMDQLPSSVSKKFVLDGSVKPVKAAYSSSLEAYVLEFKSALAEKKTHKMQVYADGYATESESFWFEWTPVIDEPEKTEVSIYASEAPYFIPEELMVTVPGTVQRVNATKKFYKGVVSSGEDSGETDNKDKTEVDRINAVKWLSAAGHTIDVVYSYDNNGHKAKEVTVVYKAVDDKPATVIAISGNKTVDNTVTATSDAGGSIAYQWQVGSSNDSISFTNIAGATGASYRLTVNEYNKYVRVVVTVGNNPMTGRKESASFKVGAGALTCKTVPDAITLTSGTKLSDTYKFTGYSFVNKDGKVVDDGVFTWISTSKGATVTTDTTGILGYTATGYSQVACKVTINVIGTKPSASEIKTITFVSPDKVEKGKFAFAVNNKAFEYRLDDGAWAPITTTPVAYGTAENIYFRRAAVTSALGYTGPSEAAASTVTVSSVAGTQLAKRTVPKVVVHSLSANDETVEYEITDSENTEGTIYNFYVYTSTGVLAATAIGKVAKTGDSITGTAPLVLQKDQKLYNDTYYYVSVVAAGDGSEYSDSDPSAKMIVMSQKPGEEEL